MNHSDERRGSVPVSVADSGPGSELIHLRRSSGCGDVSCLPTDRAKSIRLSSPRARCLDRWDHSAGHRDGRFKHSDGRYVAVRHLISHAVASRISGDAETFRRQYPCWLNAAFAASSGSLREKFVSIASPRSSQGVFADPESSAERPSRCIRNRRISESNAVTTVCRNTGYLPSRTEPRVTFVSARSNVTNS